MRVWLSAVPVCDPEVATETGTAASLMAPPARGQLGSSGMSDGGVSTSSGGPSCVVGRRVCLRWRRMDAFVWNRLLTSRWWLCEQVAPMRLGIGHTSGWMGVCACLLRVGGQCLHGSKSTGVAGGGAARAPDARVAQLLMRACM